MSMDARKAALERKHAALEAELQAITTRPATDSLHAAALKREKLRLKDEMTRMKA